ncbi:hypothetical protein PPBDW_I21210 [Photobacterium kishitanii]|nr:hypothetical protein PPBDW_I21210 [Photobacterium kishitanii]
MDFCAIYYYLLITPHTKQAPLPPRGEDDFFPRWIFIKMETMQAS